MGGRSYPILNALPPEAFLKPEDFVTGFDARNPDRAKAQYETGLLVANRSRRVGITAGGTWFADGLDGSFTTSCEGIGYHSNTADLLRGLLAGKAEFVVHRYTAQNHTTSTIIKHGS